MTGRWGLVFLLIMMGAGWGLTLPLGKMAVSEGYRHLGLVFWQMVIGALVLGGVTYARGRRLPFTPEALRVYVIIALVGTILPNSASYEAARHLPAGWLSVAISTVPMFAFPIALALGVDRFAWRRVAGLALGFGGIITLFAPTFVGSGASLALLAFVPLALIAPLLYGFEGNYVARWGTAGLDPVQVLVGASLVGALISGPAALALGAWINPLPPYGLPDGALVLASVIHVVVYATYVWLVGRAGSVFASQVAYVVTAFGVGWSMLLLDERYGWTLFAALFLIFAGLALVQPRKA